LILISLVEIQVMIAKPRNLYHHALIHLLFVFTLSRSSEKEHSHNSQLFVPQVSKALQGNEDKGVAELVPANLEGPALPPHQGSSHHSPGP